MLVHEQRQRARNSNEAPSNKSGWGGKMNKRVRITLGELIATVTDEIEQSSGRNAKTNMVVSQILNRLFNEGKVRFSRRAAPTFS